MKSENQLYSPEGTGGAIDQIFFMVLEEGTDFVPWSRIWPSEF